jgi:hypothetical protein
MPPVYPKSKILLLDSRTVLAAWLLLAAIPVVFYILKLIGTQSLAVLSFLVVLFLLTIVGHLALSFSHRCPSCGKHPTIQGFKPPHPNSAEQSALSGWAGAVVNVLRRRQLVCTHCGANFQVQA